MKRLGLVLLISGTAFAQNVPSVVVHCADLNLNTQQGMHVLERRINQAAHVVCHSYNQTEPLVMLDSEHRCVTASVQGAMEDVQAQLARARNHAAPVSEIRVASR